MSSIRARLFVVLIVTTGFVWLSAVAWIYVSPQAPVEKVLDALVQEGAPLVGPLVTAGPALAVYAFEGIG